jgi:hypothetical protein
MFTPLGFFAPQGGGFVSTGLQMRLDSSDGDSWPGAGSIWYNVPAGAAGAGGNMAVNGSGELQHNLGIFTLNGSQTGQWGDADLFASDTDVDWTIECYVNATSDGGNSLFSINPTNQSSWILAKWDETSAAKLYWQTNGTRYVEQESGTVNTGTWYHMAWVYNKNADTVTAYVNNAEAWSTSAGSSALPTISQLTGAWFGSQDGTGNYFNGKVNYMAFYKGYYLTAADIQTNYDILSARSL